MASPYVNIDLGKNADGERRKLRYRHNDIGDMEQFTGKSIPELLMSSEFHGLRVLLFYGLRWQESKMSISKAGDLIQDEWIEKGHTREELLDVIKSAMEAGKILKPLPKPSDSDEDDEGNDPPEAA